MLRPALLAATFAAAAPLLPAAPPAIPPAREVPTPAFKAPTVPPTVTVKVGRPVTLTVPKDTGYEPAFDQGKCRLVRLYSDDPEVIVLEAWPFEAGEYPVVFWAKGELRGAVSRIVTEGPPPPPPTPPVPPPDSELRAKLKAAYAADGGPTAANEGARKDLAELYRQAATLAADATLATTTQLRDKIKAASKTLTADALVGTRTAIAEAAEAVLPPDTALTADSRRAAAALFAQVAAALAW